MENNVFCAWHYIWKCLYWRTSMGVSNFMLVSKCAQFTWTLELSRRNKNALRSKRCPKISQGRVFVACAQSSTYVTTCNCIVCGQMKKHQNGCVDASRSIRFRWQRKCILLKTHLCVYGAKTILSCLKTQTVRQRNGYQCLKIVGESPSARITIGIGHAKDLKHEIVSNFQNEK